MEARIEDVTNIGRKGRRPGWMAFGLLVVTGTLASLAAVPYAMTLSGSPEVPAWAFVVGTAIAAGLGLWLGAKVGLGSWDVRGLISGEGGMARKVVRSLPFALALGAAGAVVVQLIGWIFTLVSPGAMPGMEDVEMWAPWEGLLVSVGAGVTEELWLRLGVMGVLAWLLTLVAKLVGRRIPDGEAPSWAVWSAMAGAALLFGWLYWKCGLVAAMAAHFSTDIVLKVILASLMPVFT